MYKINVRVIFIKTLSFLFIKNRREVIAMLKEKLMEDLKKSMKEKNEVRTR